MTTDAFFTATSILATAAGNLVMASSAASHTGDDIHASRIWGAAALDHAGRVRADLDKFESNLRSHMDQMEARNRADNPAKAENED